MTERSRAAAPRVLWWKTTAIVAAALFFVPLPDWAVDEFYSRDLYPWLQDGLTAVSNLMPMAALDVLLVGAVLLLVARGGLLVLALRRRGAASVLGEAARRLIRSAAVVTVVFMCMWGCNYRRRPLETTLVDGTAAPVTTTALRQAVTDANSLAASLRPSLRDQPPPPYEDVAALLLPPMNDALVRLNREPLARAGRPKVSVFLTPFFIRAGVDGMINPIALESIVNPDLLPFERGFLLAHEWAHLAGHADEAEASAVGWFACMNGPPVLAYSASLYLILEAAGNLPRAEQRQAMAALDPGVRTDLAAISERLRRQQPQVRQAAFRVYDQYLKANRVPDGTASYSRALSLILASPILEALEEYQEPGLPSDVSDESQM